MVRLWPYRDDQASDWTPDLNRDCQGKAAWARARLLEAGWPADCMELWACTTEKGKRHAVLVVTMTLSWGVKEVVIDNLIGEPRAKDQLPYKEWTRAEA
jgi:predicted transglutaminase-like cysteine proteinase